MTMSVPDRPFTATAIPLSQGGEDRLPTRFAAPPDSPTLHEPVQRSYRGLMARPRCPPQPGPIGLGPRIRGGGTAVIAGTALWVGLAGDWQSGDFPT